MRHLGTRKVGRREVRGKDEYGDDIVTVIETTREEVAYLTRHNGAWLIALSGPATDDMTPGELYNCARLLDAAKRIARAGAAELGYGPGWRWTEKSSTYWILEGTWVTERTFGA